jgi:hypothetical protein
MLEIQPSPPPPLLTLSLSSCREKVQPQEPPKLDEVAPDEREMKLVELTHRKGGKGNMREALDDVVYTEVEGDTERRREGEISKKIVDRIGDTAGNGEE